MIYRFPHKKYGVNGKLELIKEFPQVFNICYGKSIPGYILELKDEVAQKGDTASLLMQKWNPLTVREQLQVLI